MHRLNAIVVSLLLLLVACGGGSSTSSTNGSPSPAAPAGAVNVTTGATSSGVNITLPPPSANPAPNAEMLGVAVPVSGGTSITLTNAPAIVHLGSLAGGQIIVAITGTGLASGSGSSATALITSATLSGPNDITIGPISVLSDTNSNAVGVGFRITPGSSTAIGARTVFLKNAQGDTTAYSGGLEILP